MELLGFNFSLPEKSCSIYCYYCLIYSYIAWKAHCPDTSPFGKQQHKYVRIFVDLNIQWGTGLTSSLFASSWQKWLQLDENIWYFPHLYFASSYVIKFSSSWSCIYVSPRNIFRLNWYSALYGYIAITPVAYKSLSITQKQNSKSLTNRRCILYFYSSMIATHSATT